MQLQPAPNKPPACVLSSSSEVQTPQKAPIGRRQCVFLCSSLSPLHTTKRLTFVRQVRHFTSTHTHPQATAQIRQAQAGRGSAYSAAVDDLSRPACICIRLLSSDCVCTRRPSSTSSRVPPAFALVGHRLRSCERHSGTKLLIMQSK